MLGKNFATAIDWLMKTSVEELTSSKIEIDEDRVFAFSSDSMLSPKEPSYEAHRRYADIQIILKNRELFYLGTEGTMGEKLPDTDFFPCTVEACIPFALNQEWFVIFFPGEFHAPGNPVDPFNPSETCKKLVIKVLN